MHSSAADGSLLYCLLNLSSCTFIPQLPACVPAEQWPVYSRASLCALLRLLFTAASVRAADMYYRRELLAFTAEGRRIDLITLTSSHGMSLERCVAVTAVRA